MAESNNPDNGRCICGCVGYAYVPVQELGSTYDACKALENGSVFPELVLTMAEYGNTCKSNGGIC